MHRKPDNHGFHLLELLITISIVAVLISMAIPAYTHYFAQENYLEAEVALAKTAVALEEYHIEHHTYEGANLSNLLATNKIARGNYQLIIKEANNSDYLLAAISQHKQNNDCLFLNSQGVKSKTPC